MWLKYVLAVVVVGSLNLACNPCAPFEGRRPETVCVPSDSRVVEAQPFVLTATVSLSSAAEVSCKVAVDGGVIELDVSGEECNTRPGAFGAKPVVFKSAAACAIPPLEAGRYTVRGVTTSVDVVVNVGGDAGAGVPACP